MLTFSGIMAEVSKILKRDKRFGNVAICSETGDIDLGLYHINPKGKKSRHTWNIACRAIEGTSTLHELIFTAIGRPVRSMVVVYRTTDQLSDIAWEIKDMIVQVTEIWGNNEPKGAREAVEKLTSDKYKHYTERVPGFMLGAEPATKKRDEDDDIPF